MPSPVNRTSCLAFARCVEERLVPKVGKFTQSFSFLRCRDGSVDDWLGVVWFEAQPGWHAAVLLGNADFPMIMTKPFVEKYVRLRARAFFGGAVDPRSQTQLPFWDVLWRLGHRVTLSFFMPSWVCIFRQITLPARLIPTFRAVTPNQQGRSCQARPATKGLLPLADRNSFLHQPTSLSQHSRPSRPPKSTTFSRIT